MNDLAVISRKAPATGAASLVRKFDKLLAADHLRSEWTDRLAWAYEGHKKRPLLDSNAYRMTEAQQLEAAHNWADKLPEHADLANVINVFGIAATEQCPRDAAFMLCGIMVDGYPNARPANIDGYLLALVTVLIESDTDFSAYAIAKAIKDLWSDSERKFAPTSGEFLRAVQDARWAFVDALERARHLRAMRESAEGALADADAEQQEQKL